MGIEHPLSCPTRRCGLIALCDAQVRLGTKRHAKADPVTM
jgi:hypothetical protein